MRWSEKRWITGREDVVDERRRGGKADRAHSPMITQFRHVCVRVASPVSRLGPIFDVSRDLGETHRSRQALQSIYP